jgi:molybdopterin/thiamine biosynthesis adenylyltransferase/molybdopterin converting factor small subunit
MARVYIPTSLRKWTGGLSHVPTRAETVGDLFQELEQRFPGLWNELFDANGNLHRFVNVYVNDQEIEELNGLSTTLQEDDEVAVVPAMAGGAVKPFTVEQMQRYSRHIILPEIGGVGQRKLLNAKVCLIGAGGLGSPTALYLAAAGVGTLGIVDFDDVDLSNLHRQIIHGQSTIGHPKVDSAKERIAEVNPDVNVVPHREPLTSENAMEILGQYDIVVNGCDNFATRYLVNDACYLLGKPLVDGSIFKFEGQASVYIPGKGCYRCLFPAPPPPGAVPSCAEAGVLGVLPGIIGVIDAIETIKLILGLGDPLVNRLLIFDSLAMEFRQVKLRRDPECPLCGDNPTIHELIDYEAFCGAPMAQTGG